MGFPAVLAILSLIQGQSNGQQQQAAEMPTGYGDKPTNVPPGTIRSANSNTGLYQTTGKVGQQRSVQPYQYRVWDAGTNQYTDGGKVPRDRRTETESGGGGNASGIMGLIGNILGSDDQQNNQAYQMPYIRRQ